MKSRGSFSVQLSRCQAVDYVDVLQQVRSVAEVLEKTPGHAWAALLLSAAGAAAVGACALVGLKLIEWRELYRRLHPQRT